MPFFKNKVPLLALAFLMAFPALLSNGAFSHGNNPSACENRYDAEITSMTIDNGTQMFDLISDPDLQLDAQIDKGYDITFTLHTTNASSLNNTLAGTTWYRNSAFGFGSGVCIDNAGPEEDISMTVHVTPPSGIPDGYLQNNVQWGSWPNVVQFTYRVTWHSASEVKPVQMAAQYVPPESQVDNNVQDNESSDGEEEFDEDESEGKILSPFIFESSAFAKANNSTEQLPLEDALRINGTLVSYQLLNETGIQQLYILSGNWNMAMNDTAVIDFDANLTIVRSDGAARQTFLLGNLTAVNGFDMNLTQDTMWMKSTLDYHTNNATMRMNAIITLLTLNVITIELEGMDVPIYGVVGKVMLIKDGSALAMVRQFDMI